jgi:integrase
MNMNTIVVHEQSITQDFFSDSRWLQFFDVQEALNGFKNHLESLPSHETPEKYTWENYHRGVSYFIEWAGGLEMRLPTAELLTEFVAHMLNEKVWYSGNTPQYGVSASTVASSYLAPVRIFLKKLIRQRTPAKIQINPFEDTPEEKEMKRDMRDFFIECKELMRTALDEVKNPKGKKTNVSALYNPKFNRLKKRQVKKVLKSFDRSTVVGARDYLIFRIPFECGLRVAELQRVTLSSISQMDDGVYTITVRGKRSNYDPVPISKALYREILNYVELYNANLAEDDPRRIDEDMPIFQAMRKGGNYYETESKQFNPEKGLSKGGIRDVIKRITEWLLDIPCTAHDLRRTFAAMAHDAGMKIPDIQKVMRHAEAAITLRYIGTKPDFQESLITQFVNLE